MTQAEYRRPRSSGRGKMLVIAILVLVLCLACFALGIMVGGSGSEDSSLQVRDETSSPVSVRATPESRATMSDPKGGKGEDLTRRQKSAPLQVLEPVEQRVEAEPLNAEEDSAGDDALQQQDKAVQQVPLGSGINPREKPQDAVASVTENVQDSESENEVIDAEKTISSPVSKKDLASISVSASKERSEDGKYVVQIASFRADKDARALAQKLRSEFQVYVREVDLNEKGKWYRVLVGPMVEREKADEVKRRIKESAGLEGFVKRAP